MRPTGSVRPPALIAGVLLLWVSADAAVIAVPAALGFLAGWIIARRLAWIPEPVALAAAFVVATIAALSRGSELAPPAAGAVASGFVALLRGVLPGLVVGVGFVGLGLLFVAGARKDKPERATGPLRWLRPLRLAALLFLLAYSPRLLEWADGGPSLYRAEMADALRTLSFHQESHFRRNGRFATDLRAFPGYRLAPELRVELVDVGQAGWRATARHERLRTMCEVDATVTGSLIAGRDVRCRR